MKMNEDHFHRAAQLDEFEEFEDRVLLSAQEAGVNIVTRERRRSQWFDAIVERNDLEFVEQLILSGANVNETLFYRYFPSSSDLNSFAGNTENDNEFHRGSPLLFSLHKQKLEIAEKLINAGADVNACDDEGVTPLHTAAKIGCYITQLLIEKGANVNAKDFKGLTPLHVACTFELHRILDQELNWQSMFPEVITAGVGSWRIEPGWSSSVASLICLIKSETDVNVGDKDGRTPLHLLSQNDIPFLKNDILDFIVKALVDKGADVNRVDNRGQTALHIASRFLIDRMVVALLKHGASVNAVTDTKDTALHCATKSVTELETSKIAAVIETLLESGANVEALNLEGRTPLDNAKLHFRVKELIPVILSWKLSQATTEGDEELLEWVLVQGWNVPKLGVSWLVGDYSYLHNAAKQGHENIIKKLLELGVSINSVDSAKNTALHWAAENGHLASVILLLKRGASPKRRNIRGLYPVDLAKIQGHEEVVAHFEWRQSQRGIGALISFLLPQTNDMYLQKKICDLGRQLAEKEKQCALLRREQETAALQIEELLSKIGSANDTDKFELKTNMEAVRQKTDKIDSLYCQMEQMMASMEELKAAKLSRNNKTPMADERETVSVKSFVTASFRSVTDSFMKKCSIFEAVTVGDEELVVRLLGKNPDLNKRDSDKQTPLFLACKYNRHDIIRLLIVRGADVNICNKDTATPLYVASENGYADVVDCLLENKANVNASTRNNATPLLTAADNGHVFVVEALLKKGALINMAMKGGYTPLYMAAKNDRREVVQMLLEHGADANASSDKNITPLHRASVGNHREVVELLLEYGADLDALNSQRDTPDAAAEKHGHSEVRNLIASWRCVSVSERQCLVKENQRRREEQKERLRRVFVSGACSNLPTLYQQLADEILEAEDLRKTLEGLKKDTRTIPEEDETVDGESVYDANAVVARIDEVSRQLASKERRLAELRREIVEAKRQRHEKGESNFIFLKDCVIQGTVTGDVGTFHH